MSSALKISQISTNQVETYMSRIRSIDGRHPLKDRVPEACIEYPVRYRPGGKIAYFNFDLAKEMGLLPRDYPEQIDSKLERVLLETFALQIINDHDQMKAKKFAVEHIKPNRYMVTRYLQLQHPNKKGLTSGDGRSMWNGVVSFQGKTWDISSCGTGATRLSPACAIHKKHFRTGDPFVAYGCGRATLSEGLSAALMSEVFHKNSIATERTLVLIDFGKTSINVRAGENLLRPSHLFRFLKQANYEGLKKIVDYFIDRQVSNGFYRHLSDENLKYDNFLKHMGWVFAQAAAKFESEYIFCWMDWDGDNILAHKAGIIDYGSVRQFGLFHKEYRYDDVDRFSTSILEQKYKARQTVQVFCQLVEYLKTKKRKKLKTFVNHKVLKQFDRNFVFYKNIFTLEKVGFSREQAEKLFAIKEFHKTFRIFQKELQYFEYKQSSKGSYLTSDGKTSDAVFSVRDILREYPKLFMANSMQPVESEKFLAIAASSYAKPKDLILKKALKNRIKRFQKGYYEIVKIAAEILHQSPQKTLLYLQMKSQLVNRYERITGDGVLCVTDAVLRARKKMPFDKLYRHLKMFFSHQSAQGLREDIRITMDGTYPLEQTRFAEFSLKLLRIVRENRDGL